MRIDRLHLTNFKCFEDEEFTFDKEFTLFVGDNGAGKTSILSAAAVALGIWDENKTIKQTVHPEEGTWRRIYDDEIRLLPSLAGDRGFFQQAAVCGVRAEWDRGAGEPLVWSRRIERGRRISDGQKIGWAIDNIVAAAAKHKEAAPLFAYYGAGRAWLPSNERVQRANAEIKRPSQWDAYLDCLQERIQLKDLDHWFRDEAAARDDKGLWRPGYKTVQRAILNCLPDAHDILWDPQRLEICINIGGETVPFSLLSDGQKSMSAMVADLAIRAVTLNSFLFGNSKDVIETACPSVVLAQTPGVVLIDEIDIHLHPKWQRHVVNDLRKTFPKVQFICTSHSPQVFGELRKENILVHSAKDRGWHHPTRSLGVDSSRILDEEMDASSANSEYLKKKGELAEVIDREDFKTADAMIHSLAETVGEDDPDITRARTLISFLQDTK